MKYEAFEYIDGELRVVATLWSVVEVEQFVEAASHRAYSWREVRMKSTFRLAA